MFPTTSQNPSFWHPSWMNKACTTRKDSESEWLAKNKPETNPITMKPKTASHLAEQFSWVPSPSCSPPGRPFPIKSLALSAHVSPHTVHFWVYKSPVSGPGKGPPSCNKGTGLSLGFPGGETRKYHTTFFPTLNKLIYHLCHRPDAMVTVAMEILLCLVEANPDPYCQSTSF